MNNLLAISALYDGFQSLVGTRAIRSYFVSNYVKPKLGDKLLDLGCGTGGLLNHLPALNYFGYDPSEKYIKSAKAAYRNNPDVSFCSGDLNDFVFIKNSFDKVILLGVLHHVDDHVANALLSTGHLALKKGGILISMDMCEREDINVLAKWMNKFDRGKHIRTQDQYKSLLSTHFKNIEDYDYCGRGRVPLSHYVLKCKK